MLPIDRLPIRHCISSASPFSYRTRTGLEHQLNKISLMYGTIVRRWGVPAGVLQVAGASAFPGSKTQVFSEETGEGVVRRTVFLEFGLPR